jgi:LysM repeat protein
MRNKILLSVCLALALVLTSVLPLAAAPDHSGAPTWHTVSRGETLFSIGRYYGVDPGAIASANGIANLNRIYAGQRLWIPGRTTAGAVHVVQRGETLSAIALRYGLDVWTVARANGITNLNHIWVGQRLTIPGASAPSPTPSPPTPSTPSLPSSFPGPWTGEYFDNIGLTGPVYTTRQDAAINFDWNSGPPAGGMPVNAFSVRWTGRFSFPGGKFRFYARVDDGVQVYIDGARIINGWRDGSLRLYTADRELNAGEHTVQVEYYDRIQVARVYFWWQQLTSTPPPASPPPSAPTGFWSGQFFNNVDLQGTPFGTRSDGAIGFEWGTGAPLPGMRSDFFSARWTQTVYLNAATYRFCAMSDDGVRLWVDDKVVLDEWHPNNGVSYCGNLAVAAGNHAVKVEYYEDGGKALIYVWWEAAN